MTSEALTDRAVVRQRVNTDAVGNGLASLERILHPMKAGWRRRSWCSIWWSSSCRWSRPIGSHCQI